MSSKIASSGARAERIATIGISGRNIEMLPNRFIYQDRTARAVFVSSQVIVEALGKIYGADRLLEELGVATNGGAGESN